MTVRLGEKAQLTGTVNLQGNTSIDRVTVNVRGYYDAADSRVLTRTFSDNLTTVKLENYAEFVVDTTVAPFNAAGSYTIRLWASGKDGTTLTQPIAEATVLVAEPVSALPSYTVDDLVKPLKHTLSYNETKNDYGCVHNDGKSVSIGLIQWNAYAGRALPVLKKSSRRTRRTHTLSSARRCIRRLRTIRITTGLVPVVPLIAMRGIVSVSF